MSPSEPRPVDGSIAERGIGSSKSNPLVASKPARRRNGIYQQIASLQRCVYFFERVFQPYPRLWPLRDRMVGRVIDQTYSFDLISRNRWAIGRLLAALFRNDAHLSYAWLDRQPYSWTIRTFREELVECGLLEPTLEKAIVSRLAVWMDDLIEESTLAPKERRTLGLYSRMYFLRRARNRFQVDDHVENLYVNGFKTEFKLVLRFVERATDGVDGLSSIRASAFVGLRGYHLKSVRTFLRWAESNDLSPRGLTPAAVRRKSPFASIDIGGLRRELDRMLQDGDLPLDLRVAGLLSYLGYTLTRVATLRASHVLLCNAFVLNKEVRAVPSEVGTLMRLLRRERVESARTSGSASSDPRLFGTETSDAYSCTKTLTTRLSRYRMPILTMRNAATRMIAHEPWEMYVRDRSVGRHRRTTAQRFEELSSKAGSYTALSANQESISVESEEYREMVAYFGPVDRR